jgi:allatostatin receptor
MEPTTATEDLAEMTSPTDSNMSAAGNDSYYYLYDLIDLDEYEFYVALYKFTVPIVFCVIIFVGVVGNLIVVYVTLARRKMRTTVNLLLLNLAASDLIFLMVCVPFMAYHFAADNWLVGDAACKLSQYVLFVTVYVTVYTLVAIAVDR